MSQKEGGTTFGVEAEADGDRSKPTVLQQLRRRRPVRRQRLEARLSRSLTVTQLLSPQYGTVRNSRMAGEQWSGVGIAACRMCAIASLSFISPNGGEPVNSCVCDLVCLG